VVLITRRPELRVGVQVALAVVVMGMELHLHKHQLQGLQILAVAEVVHTVLQQVLSQAVPVS